MFLFKCRILTDWKIDFYILIGHKKIGESYIRNHAKKDATNNENQTPLHYAVKYGNWIEQIEYFDLCFHFYEYYLGQFEFAEMLINNGANVNVADENRNTAIHLAVEEGNFNSFQHKSFVNQINFLAISSWTSENPRTIE